MSVPALVSDFFFIAAYVALGAVFALLFMLYRQTGKLRQQSSGAPAQDFTNMMILLQTMRDVLHEQKELALQFNRNLEEKVGSVNQFLSNAIDAHAQLRDAQRKIAARLDAIQRDLDGAQIPRKHVEEASSEQSPPSASEPAPEQQARESLTAPLQALAHPEENDVDTGQIENWVGLDFTSEGSQDAFPVPEETPEAPEDPEAARDAFRALLNMDTQDASARRASNRPGAGDDTGNGRDRTAVLRKRVYQYSDAGMNVAQIARELGIGKGEVRLMVSLREKR